MISRFKELIKQKSLKSARGILLYARFRAILEKIALASIGDERYIRTTYKKRFGRQINLINPNTYTEKLQWLKLFYRNDKMPICSDKYAVHQYLENHGHKALLNEILGVYKKADDIDFDSLPNSFVAKTTHGCGQNLICKDKNELDWKKWKEIIDSWLKLNVYAFGREWNYHHIPRRILIERFIDHEPLVDYKFMCFNGEPKFLQINNDRDGKHYVDFYDIEWNKVDFTYDKFEQSDYIVPPPDQIKEMIAIAKKLSAPFPYVRVDFYNPPNKIIFGELTFFPGSGLLPLVPLENKYDELLGSYIDLPSPNHNLALQDKMNRSKSWRKKYS
ncbi:ATP-grasp fold amidoligase family protein [Pareuzebyella sediminis]|uniref:ATP-grasp fold amidoligase family protein n=1 Tax=Pareuzebyella sediminis TaxID=2607998 RepID=UPI0011EE37AA|nr:ATP-grasp fold amidoligase family protein [Pareuzebyella sediminis]